MKFLTDYYKSSIGKKWIVALTGIVLIAYIIGHLAGNLQIFISPEQINWYGERLHSLGILLWIIRAFLFVCFVAHIYTTILLSIENRKARPERYAVKKNIRTTRAALTMVLSGLFLLAFVIIHLLQFTIRPAGLVESHTLPNGGNDVYTMVVTAFGNPLASGLLHHRHVPALHAPQPWVFQFSPDTRAEQRKNRAHPGDGRHHARMAGIRRLHLHPRRGHGGIPEIEIKP